MRAVLFTPAYPLADAATRTRALAAARRLLGAPVADACTVRAGRSAWTTPAERAAALAAALASDLAVAARGGHGCIHLLDDAAAHRGPLPRLVGYSDVTALHALWWRRGRRDGIHGWMPAVAHGARARTSTAALLAGERLRLSASSAGRVRVLRRGSAAGPLFPACLRVLASLAGTRHAPDLSGAVLCLEDIDEAPYRIDRDLWQLHAAGLLDGVRGLVFGRFPWPRPPGHRGPPLATVLGDWADRLGVPAIAGLRFGHDPDPVSLPVGWPARLRCGPTSWDLTCRPA